MIEFIIVDENYKETKKILENKLMNYDYNYKIIAYSDYSNIKIDSNCYKIYIIDYSKKQDKGMKILKHIRYELNDWKSMIIVTTSNNRLRQSILDDNLLIIGIVDKTHYYQRNLELFISRALINYDTHPKTLRYQYKGIIYNINFKDIIIIEKEKDNKRCLIKTNNNVYPIQKNISNIINLLDKRFIKCSRSYIINLEQVKQYNIKNNVIYLNEDIIINEISRRKKKEIINYLRNVE